MSRHIYHAKDGEVVEIEWDHSSNRYRLWIDGTEESIGGPDDLFRANPAHLTAILGRLRSRNIRLPEPVIRRLEAERRYSPVPLRVRHRVKDGLCISTTTLR